MEEITALLKSGLPWYATVLMLVGGVYVGRWIDGWIKLRAQRMTERQYDDSQTRDGYEALISELKEQVKELKANQLAMLAELKEVRAAHAKCEIQHAELKGRMEVMDVKLSRLESHDKANKEQLDVLKEDLGKS